MLGQSSTKYLGVFIDNKLNFEEHILTLENKIARSVGILSKVRYNFPLKTLLQLYHALIHPLLTYGIVVWGSTYPSYLSKLKTLQNKTMRIISGSHYCDEANPIYKNLGQRATKINMFCSEETLLKQFAVGGIKEIRIYFV